MTSTNQPYTEQVTTSQTTSVTSSFSTTTITNSTTTTHTTVATSTSKTGLNDGEIAGVAVGVIVFILIIVAIIIYIVIRRRKHSGESVSDKERNDVEIKKSVEQSKKRGVNRYVKESSIKPESPVYENPGGNQENYENVNTDESQSKKNTKPAFQKQDSIPNAPAPPPPIDRTSLPVNKGSTCPEIEEDEYIVPEDPSKLNVKPPLYNKREPQCNEKELYLAMDSPQREEMYLNPVTPHNQESYMNIDVQAKIFVDEQKTEGSKYYVNLSKQEKGVAFGVRPKEIHETPRRETTIPVTKSDEGSYQNVLYENASKQNKKPRRKK